MRCRIVTEQSGAPEHIHAIVLTEDEAHSFLDDEVFLHEKTGWTVTRSEDVVVARRGDTIRVISVRRTTPMEDPVF